MSSLKLNYQAVFKIIFENYNFNLYSIDLEFKRTIISKINFDSKKTPNEPIE